MTGRVRRLPMPAATDLRHVSKTASFSISTVPNRQISAVQTERIVAPISLAAGWRPPCPASAQTYSVEFWFWNGLPNDARPVTAYLFSRGKDGAAGCPGRSSGHWRHPSGHPGKLIFFNGNARNTVIAGQTIISPKTWNHVVLVRSGSHVAAYLERQREPEIAGDADVTCADFEQQLFFAGRNDNFANLEGKLDEIAIFDRALTTGRSPITDRACRLRPEHVSAASPSEQTVAGTAGAIFGKASDGPAARPPRSPESLARCTCALDFSRTGRGRAARCTIRWPSTGGRTASCGSRRWPTIRWAATARWLPGGRIRTLEDTDGDGNYDRSTLFLDGVNFPNGVHAVAQRRDRHGRPEIFYAEDTDCRRQADVRKTLYQRFQPKAIRSCASTACNGGSMAGSYCANGWSGGAVRSTRQGDGRDSRTAICAFSPI